ncbi:MAG TPA: MFS transporter [Chloroflexota bacterium]|nr:MFS transporter [Chloroflexota bacterium]
MKLFYLCFYVATGIYSPYAGLYLQAIHLDGAQIGLIAWLPPVAGVVLPPLWGMLSDHFGWRKPVLAMSLLVAALAAPAIPLAGGMGSLVPLMGVLAVALSPVVPLADSTTLEWLRQHGGSYGSVRFYGSLGFLLSSVIAGQFLGGRNILALFPVYGLFLFSTFVASLLVPSQDRGVRLARGEGIASVLRDRVVALFLVCALVGYGTFAAYNTFFSLYMKGLGAGTGVIGLAAGIATLSELPVMALAGWAIRRIGVKPLLIAGLTSDVVRWTAYALLHDYRLALLFQPLHGLGFAGFYVAGVTFVEQRVPARLRSTGQTLFNAALFGVGSVAGSNLFGHLYDHLHASGMFLVAALLCLPALAGVIIFVPSGVADGQ